MRTFPSRYTSKIQKWPFRGEGWAKPKRSILYSRLKNRHKRVRVERERFNPQETRHEDSRSISSPSSEVSSSCSTEASSSSTSILRFFRCSSSSSLSRPSWSSSPISAQSLPIDVLGGTRNDGLEGEKEERENWRPKCDLKIQTVGDDSWTVDVTVRITSKPKRSANDGTPC